MEEEIRNLEPEKTPEEIALEEEIQRRIELALEAERAQREAERIEAERVAAYEATRRNITLDSSKTITPKKLYLEIINELGYEIDFELKEVRRTRTIKDDLGRETIENLGFSFDIVGVKEEDFSRVQAKIDSHTPDDESLTLPAQITKADYLDLLARIERLEER